MGVGAEPIEPAAKLVDAWGQAFEDVFAEKGVERRQGDGGAERVPAVGVAVVESGVGRGGVGTGEGGVDCVGGEGGGQGEVAASEALGQAEEVRGDAFTLAGEEGSGSAHADGDLVEDQQGVVLANQLGQLSQEAVGVDPNAGSALNDRLKDNGGNLAGMLAQQAVDGLEGFGRILGRRAGSAEGGEQEGAKHGVEAGNAAEADIAEGIAVVGAVEGEEEAALGFGGIFLAPVLEGEFEGHFDGGGSRVGEEDTGQPGWSKLGKPAGEADGRFVGQAQEGGVGDPVELTAEGSVERGVAVAEEVAPEGGDAINVAASSEIDEKDTLGAVDKQGFGGEPVGLVGERVPDVVVVPGGEGREVDGLGGSEGVAHAVLER